MGVLPGLRQCGLAGGGHPQEANAAKWLCADAGFAAVQTHGGYGYAREYHVSQHVLGLPKSH